MTLTITRLSLAVLRHHEAAKNKIKGWEKIDPHNLYLIEKGTVSKKAGYFFYCD